MDDTEPGYLDKMIAEMQKGTKFATPYLDYNNLGQEGIHRSMAADALGMDSIPVVVIKPKLKDHAKGGKIGPGLEKYRERFEQAHMAIFNSDSPDWDRGKEALFVTPGGRELVPYLDKFKSLEDQGDYEFYGSPEWNEFIQKYQDLGNQHGIDFDEEGEISNFLGED
jgi:hypothetical protein